MLHSPAGWNFSRIERRIQSRIKFEAPGYLTWSRLEHVLVALQAIDSILHTISVCDQNSRVWLIRHGLKETSWRIILWYK